MAVGRRGESALNIRALKNSLRQGHVAIGTWVFEFNTPGIARLLASTGIDYVAYDMEHSGFGVESIRNLVSQSRSIGLAALVRPPAAHYHLIAPLLDTGADGIVAPMVETPSEASQVVGSCRYPPEGRRGAAFSISHDDFLPGEVAGKIKRANESVLCSVIIETMRGVENAEGILAVPGIDLVWVGYLDLSLSAGTPGQFDHPQFLGAMNYILKACESHRVPAAIVVASPKQAMERVRQGFRCLSYWGDIWLLQQAISEGVQAIRLGLSKQQAQPASQGARAAKRRRRKTSR